MLPHLIALTLLTTAPSVRVQDDGPSLAAVSLTADEATMVSQAVAAYASSVDLRLKRAKESEDDTDDIIKQQAGVGMLQRAISAATYPSLPPTTEPTALRKWLYLHYQAMGAVTAFGAAARKDGRKTVADAAVELLRRMGQQYDAAVDGQDEATLRNWGYFEKKYGPNFKAEPVALPEWQSDLAPMEFKARASSPAGPLQLLVDIGSGDVVSGEREIKVNIKSESLPTKVELYVDGELRATSEAKPFRFPIDALDEQEGDLNLKFVGYDEKGTRAEFPLKVKIATGSTKGAEYNVARAREALGNQDFAQAERLARVALRAQSDSVEAKIIAASAAYKRGRIDLAEKYALDVDQAQPNNLQNLDLLAGINVYKVFETRSTGDAQAASQAIADALSAAASYRRRSLEQREELDLARAKTPVERADAYLRNYRYSLAIDAVKKTAEDSDFKDNAAVSRLAYCLMRLSRYPEASKVLTRNALVGSPNQYLQFLQTVLLETDQADEKAEAVYKKAVAQGSNWSSKSFDAFLTSTAATPGRVQYFVKAVRALESLDSSHPVTCFYSLRLAWARKLFDRQTSALRAGLTREPASYDLLVEQGCQQLGSLLQRTMPNDMRQRRAAQAVSSFKAALQAKPDAAEALNGYALVLAVTGKWDEALKMADAARRAGVNYPSGWFTYAAITESEPMTDLRSAAARKRIQARHEEAVKCLDNAVKQDKRFKGLAPRLDIAFVQYQRLGRPPVVSTPAEAEASAG